MKGGIFFYMYGKVKVIVVKERFPNYQYLALGVSADEAGWGSAQGAVPPLPPPVAAAKAGRKNLSK
jgi:hypothetical protein